MSATVLERCTHLDRQTFAESVWSVRPSLSHAAELPAPGYSDLFGINQADQLLSRQGLRTPFLRAAKDGVALSPGSIAGPAGVGAQISDQVDDTKVTGLFASGATIVLQGLHRTHPPLEAFARGLAGELGHPVQVNAYITPPESQGFSAHYDTHDVFVLQVCGRKRWIIHEPVIDSPLPQQPWPARREAVEAAASAAPHMEAILEPGDALYLPRGWLHAAVALDQISIHLTVGIHVWTRRHLVERILASAGERQPFRTSLPIGVDFGDPSTFKDDFAAVVSALRAVADEAAMDEVSEALRDQVGRSMRPEPIGPIAQGLLAHEAGPDLAIRWRDGIRRDARPSIDTDCDLRALQRLCAGGTVTAGELGLATARAALAEGLVVPCP
ncbi:hypothetical protein JOE57_000010 [Microlunatus panaciterrae]|uniref:JmjC domain-containing protein n=1 Tax=Microlunatus panaciterrae TaxID=400768 RepID=A0ABS2RGN8_9ACTN|nr:hypothetical protein [Microlunatus panaciterrae]